MTIPKGRYMFGLLATVAMLLIMSACSLGSGSTGSGTPGSKTGAQVLQNTANTMKQLKAIHLNMQVNTKIVAVDLKPTPGSTTPTNINLNINANGDAVMPGQVSLKLNIGGFSGLKLNLAEILKGDKAYIQNSKGQWYMMDKSRLFGSNGSSNPLSSASVPNFKQLIDIGQHAQFTDHGDQSLNGQHLRHITVTLDKNALKDLLNSTGQLKGLTGSSQQVFKQFMSSIKNFQATLDFWIDESTSYLHRVEMKLNLNLATRSFATPGTTSSNMPSAVTLRSDTIVDLSRFNDSSITITAPANTIPTDNPSTIFSSSQH